MGYKVSVRQRNGDRAHKQVFPKKHGDVSGSWEVSREVLLLRRKGSNTFTCGWNQLFERIVEYTEERTDA